MQVVYKLAQERNAENLSVGFRSPKTSVRILVRLTIRRLLYYLHSMFLSISRELRTQRTNTGQARAFSQGSTCLETTQQETTNFRTDRPIIDRMTLA